MPCECFADCNSFGERDRARVQCEPYLLTCLRSVSAQTYDNIEIIIVDDGSTDGSSATCDAFVAFDDRASVFHKANGGLSDARNFGLRVARGEWVAFVDSDDYVSPVFVEALLSAALACGCAMAAIPMGKLFADGASCEVVSELGSVPEPTLLESHRVQKLMLYQVLDTGAPWRLYRRETLGVDPFPVGLYYEDLASVYKFIERVTSLAILDCPGLYAYRRRSEGIVRQPYRPIKADSAITVSRQLYADICFRYPDLATAAASRCFSVLRMVLAQIPRAEAADLDRVWVELAGYRRTVLFDPCARKRERLAAAVACSGRSSFLAFCAVCRKMGLLR